jgi:hypothetical protein
MCEFRAISNAMTIPFQYSGWCVFQEGYYTRDSGLQFHLSPSSLVELGNNQSDDFYRRYDCHSCMRVLQVATARQRTAFI